MLWFAAALATPEVLSSTVDEGNLGQRLDHTPADLVILYGGEQDGTLGTCGCPGDPKGSLGRVHGYAEAVREQGSPILMVNAGNWLTDPVGPDNGLHPAAFVRNRHMVDAVEDGWDVLNVSFRDLPYLGREGAFPAQAVSANLHGGPPSHRIVERGGVKVALTGVTAWKKDYLQPEGFQRLDPIEALAALLPTLREEADLVVVTSFGLGRRNKELAALDIDVLIDADTHRGRADALVHDGTVWVRSRYETRYLGELRLELADGAIVSAHDRAVALDKKIPTARGWKKRQRAAAKALEP